MLGQARSTAYRLADPVVGCVVGLAVGRGVGLGVGAGVGLGVGEGVGDGEAVGIGVGIAVGATVGTGVTGAAATAVAEATGGKVGIAAASSSPPRAITNATEALAAMTSTTSEPSTAGVRLRPRRTAGSGASAMTTAPRR